MKFPDRDFSVNLSAYGNAHRCVHFDGIVQPEFSNVDDPRIVTDISLTEPIKYPRIGRAHWTRIHELLEYFPNSKVIYIYSERSEYQLIAFNIFFKKFIENYEKSEAGKIDFVNFLYNNRDLDIDPSTSPRALTKNQYSSIIKRIVSQPDRRWRKLLYDHPSILQVNFADIGYGRMKLLGQLSTFTGLPVSDNALNFFRTYVDRQPKPSDFINSLKD